MAIHCSNAVLLLSGITLAMQIDLNDVQTFVTVAETKTFSAAAREMRLPTSTVSRAIKRLENSLGMQLYLRNQRGLTLTEAGQQYLSSCKQALGSLRQGRERIDQYRAEPSGLLRVKCPMTMAREVLTPLLKTFQQRHPLLRLRIDPYCSDWDQEPREDVDVFFKLKAPRESRRRMKMFPGTLRGLFASREYLASHHALTVPQDLLEHCCIGAGTWRLTRGEQVETPPIVFQIVTSDPFIHLNFLRQKNGIGNLPLWMAGHYPEELVRVLPDWQPDVMRVCALFFNSSEASPKVKAFLTFMDEHFGTELDPRLKGQAPEDVFADVRHARRDKQALPEQRSFVAGSKNICPGAAECKPAFR